MWHCYSPYTPRVELEEELNAEAGGLTGSCGSGAAALDHADPGHVCANQGRGAGRVNGNARALEAIEIGDAPSGNAESRSCNTACEQILPIAIIMSRHDSIVSLHSGFACR